MDENQTEEVGLKSPDPNDANDPDNLDPDADPGDGAEKGEDADQLEAEGQEGEDEENKKEEKVLVEEEEEEEEEDMYDSDEYSEEEDGDYFVEYVDDLIQISVLSLFFAPILGTVAVVKSCESKQYSFKREYDSARRAARTAKRLAFASFLLGVIFLMFVITVNN